MYRLLTDSGDCIKSKGGKVKKNCWREGGEDDDQTMAHPHLIYHVPHHPEVAGWIEQ